MELSDAEKAFEIEVREWLATNLPADPDYVARDRDALIAWQRKLASKRWLAIGWPEEHGGPGWSLTRRYIWDEERARAGAPEPSAFGLQMVGPVIIHYGTDEQKKRFLPPIAHGEVLWCQGYSEPGSGSDLASLQTRAERVGDEYVVNGQKIWTTNAHWADWCFCLVRTSKEEKKQKGISFLLIDMKSPGIEVRPIITIDGEHHLNEVFFSDVRVPVANRIGIEGEGWTVAKYLLGHERTGTAGVPGCKREVEILKAIAAKDPALRNNPDIVRRIAALEVDLLAFEYTNLRALDRARKGQPPGPESSGLKIKGTELQQKLSELKVEMGGYATLPWHTSAVFLEEYVDAAPAYNYRRAASIYSGSNEIQKNVIAKQALGL